MERMTEMRFLSVLYKCCWYGGVVCFEGIISEVVFIETSVCTVGLKGLDWGVLTVNVCVGEM